MPAHEGFRLPGEFERHLATWLMWPVRPDNWRDNAYFGQHDVLSIAALISGFEPVRLAVPEGLENKLSKRTPIGVHLVSMAYDDTWIRDTGPTILVASDGRRKAVDWKFNSWGGLFSSSSADDDVASKVAAYEGIEAVKAPIVLEGGAILPDGRGTLITTAECVCAENRNPGLDRKGAERVFKEFLNIERTVWIPNGIVNDEAGGHIDNLCLFASEDVLVVANEPDNAQPNHKRLAEAQKVLRSSTNARGRSYEIVLLDLPEMNPITEAEAAGFSTARGTIKRAPGSLLAPSYLNSCILNGAVIVPTFNQPADQTAIETMSRCFPSRKIIPFHCREFLLGGGAIHCLTKEVF